MTSYSLTVQMKAAEQFFHVVLFVVLYNVVLCLFRSKTFLSTFLWRVYQIPSRLFPSAPRFTLLSLARSIADRVFARHSTIQRGTASSLNTTLFSSFRSARNPYILLFVRNSLVSD